MVRQVYKHLSKTVYEIENFTYYERGRYSIKGPPVMYRYMYVTNSKVLKNISDSMFSNALDLCHLLYEIISVLELSI